MLENLSLVNKRGPRKQSYPWHRAQAMNILLDTVLQTCHVFNSVAINVMAVISTPHCPARGCFTNVSRALQDILSKFVYCRNRTSYENFKLKLCTCAQSHALGTRTKFQLEIVTANVIYGIVYFREIILESSREVSETTPWHPTMQMTAKIEDGMGIVDNDARVSCTGVCASSAIKESTENDRFIIHWFDTRTNKTELQMGPKDMYYYAKWSYHKTLASGSEASIWKLCGYWTKALWKHQIAVETQGTLSYEGRTSCISGLNHYQS